MCNLGDPGKPARFLLLWSCQMCFNFWKRNIMFLRSEPGSSYAETEGFILTDVSFCQKQLLYFLDNSVLCVYDVSLRNSRLIMCNLGDPGKPARFILLWSCQMCFTFWKRNIMLLPIVLEEVRCIVENILCELYVVNSFSCHTSPKAWHAPSFLCSFSCCTVLEVAMEEKARRPSPHLSPT